MTPREELLESLRRDVGRRVEAERAGAASLRREARQEERSPVIRRDQRGAYALDEAAAAAERKAEGLRNVLGHAERVERGGNPRLAKLLLRGALGDKIAAAAFRSYSSDAELEAAERLSRAQDYTDGGRPWHDDDEPDVVEREERRNRVNADLEADR